MLVFLHAFLEKKEEPAAVLWSKENILTGVAPQNDMEAGAGIMDSGFTRHVVFLTQHLIPSFSPGS